MIRIRFLKSGPTIDEERAKATRLLKVWKVVICHSDVYCMYYFSDEVEKKTANVLSEIA